jgi:FkbM family methyltransferase
MLEFYAIDTVLDVGANAGQFALQLRKDLDYTRRLLSFEPVSAPYALLKACAQGDPQWETFPWALGDADGQQTINVAGNSYSSSLLAMLPAHEQAAPESKYVGQEMIEVKALDSIFGNLCPPGARVYLKIDTQGFESKVLKGAESSLAKIDLVQMELSLVPLYKDEMLFREMYQLMCEKGFGLVAVDSVFSDPGSGQVLQVDALFHRAAAVAT